MRIMTVTGFVRLTPSLSLVHGLIRMAFGTIAQSRRPTFFESLIAQRKLPAPLFSVHLSRHEENGSSVCFLSVLLWWYLTPGAVGVLWLCRPEPNDRFCDLASCCIQSKRNLYHFAFCLDPMTNTSKVILDRQHGWAVGKRSQDTC